MTDDARPPHAARQSTGLAAPILTLVVVAISMVGAFLGSGAVVGDPVNEVAGGWLGADATPIAPASTAFSIWSVIYAGLAGYAVWQLLPGKRADERHRRLRPWAAASAVLNALWLGVTQAGWLGLSVVVMLALLAVLIRILLVLHATPRGGWVETVLVDGTFGLYLGWVSVATAANITSWLAASGADGFSGWVWVTVGVLVVLAAVFGALAGATRGRLAPALAAAWGTAWIAVARSTGQFESDVLVWTAGTVAAAVLLTAVAARLRRR